jgi:hypothetical protein
VECNVIVIKFELELGFYSQDFSSIHFYRNKRTGLIAIKLGSYPQWLKDGKKIYTTLLQV